MKKSILQFSVIAAIAASMTLTTSCSSEESVAEAYVPEPVQFSVGLGDLSVSRASSRGDQKSNVAPGDGKNFTIDNKWQANDKLAIYTHDADGKWYLKEYKVTTGSASPNANTAIEASGATDATKNFYWGTSTEVKIFEVYSIGTSDNITNTAANAGIEDSDNTTNKGVKVYDADPNNYEVLSDQSESNKEFLWNYGAIKRDNSVGADNTKNLKLNHQLTRIDVQIFTDKPYTTTVEDKKVYIGDHTTGNANIKSKGYFVKPDAFTTSYITSTPSADDLNIAQYGTWTLKDDKICITPRVLEKETQVDTDGDSNLDKYKTVYSAVIIPQDLTNEVLFDIVYDGARYTYKGGSRVGHESDENFTSAAGKHYTYKIVVGPDDLNVTASISNWVEATGYTSASPQEVPAVLQ